MAVPDFLRMMRLRNVFGTPPIYGNDLPSQGGITGNMPWGNDAVSGVTPPTFDENDPEYSGQIPNPLENVGFEAPQPMGMGDVEPQQQSSGLDIIANKMKELYTPEHEASDRYNQLLSQYPNRQDYKPGFWRSLGSMIVDYTKGPERGQAMYNEPYNAKLMDWKNQITPAQNAANLERYNNTNERSYAFQTVANMLRQEAIDNKEKQTNAELKIKQQRADVYDWKAKHPTHKIVIPKGGNIYAVDPITGEKIDLGIPSGSLTEKDKYDLIQKNTIAAIEKRGEEARSTEETKQTNREDLQDKRAWEIANIEDPDNPGRTKAVQINKITGEVREVKFAGKGVGTVAKPSSTAGKAETASNEKIRIYNAATKLRNTNPDLAPFIHVDTTGSNTVEIDQPGKAWLTGRPTGPNPDQYRRINEALYGLKPTRTGVNPNAQIGATEQANSPVTTETQGKTYTTPKGKVTTKPGYILVEKNGEYGQVPMGKLADAMKEGYKEVQ